MNMEGRLDPQRIRGGSDGRDHVDVRAVASERQGVRTNEVTGGIVVVTRERRGDDDDARSQTAA